MRYGIYVPNLWDFGSPDRLLDLALEAEASGWDGFFIWDHLLDADAAAADPQITLAAIAARTERLATGALLTPLARRRPWKVARELASLAALAPGRIVASVGLGVPADYRAFSSELQSDQERGAALDDGLEIVRELLSSPDPVRWTRPPDREAVLGALVVASPAFTPRPPQAIPFWAGARIQRDPGRRQPRKPFARAATLEGLFPVASDWAGPPLSPDELAHAVQLTFGADATRVPDGYDLVTCGRTRGVPSASDPGAYATLGLTWWLEQMPDDASIEQARGLIRQGPPE